MEIIVAAGFGLIIYSLISRRKNRHQQDQFQDETPEQRKLRQTDEHITVVLPTIDNDK